MDEDTLIIDKNNHLRQVYTTEGKITITQELASQGEILKMYPDEN